MSEILAARRAWWLVGGLVVALAWAVMSGVSAGSPDKWAMLWVGLALIFAAGRAGLARRWSVPADWLLAACYLGLGLLALLSPFWYVVPYLRP